MKKSYGNKKSDKKGYKKTYGQEKTNKGQRVPRKKIHSHKGGKTKSLQAMYVETIEGNCYKVDEEGFGLVQYKKQNLKIKGLFKGEVGKINIYQKGKYYEGQIDEIIKASQYRVKAPCPYFNECGGCQIQHLSNKGQNEFKASVVKGLLGKYHGVNPMVTMETPYRYRNKIHGTFGKNRKGEIICGFYKPFSHDLIDIKECLIQDAQGEKIIKTIKQIARKYKMSIYNEDTERGYLRHVLIRTGYTSKEVMVVLVTTDKIFTGKNNFVKLLRKNHPEITTIVLNVNDESTNMILGEEEFVLYGKGYIQDSLCGLKFNISPKSFYQINPRQTERLYTKAIDMANLKGDEIVLDAYSGIGTIGLIASQKAKHVIGVELNGDAVRNARHNSKINGITNTKFYEGDAGEFMQVMAQENNKIDVVFMDPPRSGSTEAFMSSVVKLAPEKVIYISCNPVTQKRDLEFFIARGYEVSGIQPVDMFPQTGHVETVVKLQRVNR